MASETIIKATPRPRYKRVLLKLSGEALMGDQQYGQDPKTIYPIARELKQVIEMRVQVSLVLGGGNIYRGIQAAAHGVERASADYMGMLATVLDALPIQNELEKIGME